MAFIQNFFSKFSATKPVDAFTWTKELKGMDDVSAIEFCAAQLNTDIQKDLFKDEQHLTQLLLLDEKMHIIVERVTVQYVNIDHINPELEDRIENTVFLYHRQIFLIYISLLKNVDALDHDSTHIMLTRAMINAIQMIKWRYYCYQSAPANVWQQLSNLYQLAEQLSLVNIKIEAYPEHEPTSLSVTYITACMLGSLESLSLKSQQIELVSKMLASWTAQMTIDHVYDEKNHLFYVDTASNTPAKRIRNFKPVDTYRYWTLADCNINIELCLSLIEFNIVPKQHVIKELIKNPYALATLEILRAEWSRIDYKRQRRSEERVKTIQSATTAYGFEDVCYQLKQYESTLAKVGNNAAPSASSLDEKLATNHLAKTINEPNVIYMDFSAGHSNIVDESSKGLGLHISKHANEVSLGMLVCVTSKDQKNLTKIGTIRSIRPIAGGELHIGVEVFTSNATRAEAKNMDLIANQSISNSANNTLNLSSSSLNFICLHLPQENGISLQETLIIPKTHFSKNETYKINILGEDKIIKSTDILEQREDWVRISFEQL